MTAAPEIPVLPVRKVTTGHGGQVPSDLRLIVTVDALGRTVRPVVRGTAYGRADVVGYQLCDGDAVDPAVVLAFFEREKSRRRKVRDPK